MTETTMPARAAQPSLLLDPVRFEAAQRAGKMMAMSALFPQHLRAGAPEAAVANAVLVMNIADRMREDPLAVAQNIYFVGGRPGWNASYMISRANQSGVFRGPIRWRIAGSGDSLEVTAYARMADDGEEVSASTSMKMAKAESWTKNPKYASMPDQMLRYRAATFLIRLYCPEVMLGYQTVEEIEDVRAAEAIDVTPPAAAGRPAEPETPKAAEPAPEAKAPEPPRGAAGRPQKGAISDPRPADETKPAPAEDIEEAEVIQDDDGPFTPDSLPKEWRSVWFQIVDDLRGAETADTINGIVGIFSDQIDALQQISEAAHAAIEDEISAAHERAAG